MSRIGKKLITTVIICIALVTTVAIAVTITLSSQHSDSLMNTSAVSGANFLKSRLEQEQDRMESIFDIMTAADAFSDNDALNRLWSESRESDKDFAAVYNSSGQLIWSTDNYKLADLSLSSVKGDYSGIINDSSAGLAVIFASAYSDGVAVMGMGLDEDSYLEDVKAETGAEVTVFQGKVRYSTTVLNADGSKAVGTEMSSAVAESVISKGEDYDGQADILGQNHFVHYEPMYDINGKIIGAYFAGYSSAESDALFTKMVIIAIAVAAAVAVISAFVMFSFIKRMIELPILEAEKIADNMSRGELNVPDSDHHFANDEIGDFVHKLEGTKHTLNSYIADISRILSAMADGDFSKVTEVDYAGEFAEIKRSFEVISRTLRELIGNMNMSAADVQNGSEQIAGGSQMLADGTTKQASAIEELSAAIHEITQQVRQSADNAAQASRLAEMSEEKIIRQDNEMTNMLSAMNDIKIKSDQIEKIIKEIDDIAFQTNILALNAAVEAARAGDAGKGFAVVADEVRNLAAKSAESAKNTGTLINATIQAVDNGAAIAQNTAAIMKEVIDISERTNSLINEISVAAENQSQSIRQINTGVEQIATVVQQNSATAEETAASCEELNSQSKLLRQQVDRLKV